MAILAKIALTTSKKVELAAAASGGDKFLNTNGRAYLVIKNGHISATRTVTIHAEKVCNFGYEHNMVAVIPAGETWHTPLISKTLYGDVTGYTNITYSDSAADITIACVQL